MLLLKMIQLKGKALVISRIKTANLWSVIRLWAWVPGILYVLSRFLPCHPIDQYGLYMPVDDAWALVMHQAFVQHLQFGRDIVFSYGPWGLLARGYYPATFLICMTAWLALSVVFICAGWRVARYFTRSQVLAWFWLIGFTAMASLPTGSDFNNRLAAWGVLLLCLHFFVEEAAFSPLQALLVFTLGWFGLVKFLGFMEGGLLVAVIALDNVFRHRRFPWIIPVWLAGIIFFWLLAGQHPDSFWPFVKNSWTVATGYTDAMNEGNVFILNPLVYLLIAAGFCVLGALLVRTPQRGRGIFFFVLASGGLLFLIFKASYVRDDDAHEISAGTTFVMMALACFAVAATRKKSLLIGAATLLLVSISFIPFLAELQNPSQRFPHLFVQSFSPDNLFAPFLGVTTDTLRQSHEHQLERLEMLTPLPAVPGEADLYSHRLDFLFANKIAYRPRPVIQSYSAYTPELARMNADWLRTGRAATNLFFAIDTLDARYPSQDDGLSWPELLTRYDVTGMSDKRQYLCLTRSPNPRTYRIKPLQEATITAGKRFVMPVTNGLIWADLEIKKTFAGELLSFFYKPAILVANVKLADGTSHVCHIIPGIASAGFLFSPFVSNNGTFLALAEGDQASLAARAVVALTLFEKGQSTPSFCYQPEIKIRFYRLEFPPQSRPVNFPANR